MLCAYNMFIGWVPPMEKSNLFLRAYLMLQGPGRSTVLPDDWGYVEIVLLTKSSYHTCDVNSVLIAVSHHCGLLNVPQLLARVEPLGNVYSCAFFITRTCLVFGP